MPGERVWLWPEPNSYLPWAEANCWSCQGFGCPIAVKILEGLLCTTTVPAGVAARLHYHEGESLGPCPERRGPHAAQG